jgi:predicted Zn-dependent protease
MSGTPAFSSNGASNIVSDGWSIAKQTAGSVFTRTLSLLDQMNFQVKAGLAQIGPVSGAEVRSVGLSRSPVPWLVADSNWFAPAGMTAAVPAAPAIPAVPREDDLYWEAQYWVRRMMSGEDVGLPPAIEQQLWDRHRDRAVAANQNSVADATYRWSAGGWDLPGGDVIRRVTMAQRDAVDGVVAEGRNIAIQHADMMVKARQFAIEQAKEIYFQGIKAQIDAILGTHQAAVAAYEAEVKQYLARVQWGVEAYRNYIESIKNQQDYYDATYRTDAAVYDSNVKLVIGEANAKLEQAAKNMGILAQKTQQLETYYTASAQITAGLTASIYSSINMAAGVSDSYSLGTSSSFSSSFSQANSSSTSSSTNNSNITQNSTSDMTVRNVGN